jgi:predicted nucleic acid-binding protein
VIVVDTGPLVALADADDSHHAACARWYDSAHPRNLVIPTPVIAEACHLIGTRHLVRQYASLPLGGTDACVAAIAERWQAKQVSTVDRRHFNLVRPKHVPAFELLPYDL